MPAAPPVLLSVRKEYSAAILRNTVGRFLMKRSILPIVIAASVIGMAGPASTQDTASQIAGVWKLQKFDRCIVGGECAPTYGEKPTGYIVYTKSGLFMSQGYHTS